MTVSLEPVTESPAPYAKYDPIEDAQQQVERIVVQLEARLNWLEGEINTLMIEHNRITAMMHRLTGQAETPSTGRLHQAKPKKVITIRPDNLSLTQSQILAALAERQPLTANQLQDLIPQKTVKINLLPMVQAGLLIRRESPYLGFAMGRRKLLYALPGYEFNSTE